MTISLGEALTQSLLNSLSDIADSAAAIASIVAGRAGKPIHSRDFDNIPSSAIERVANDFCSRRWITPAVAGWRVTARDEWHAMPEGVPDFLHGAAAMRRLLDSGRWAIAAVTMPQPPSALANALPSTGMAHAGLVSTQDAMCRVADSAMESLTVMTPFLNVDGLGIALQLFERSPARRKLLIVRPTSATRTILASVRDRMTAADVVARGYLLPALRGDGYETFHAKVVLADSTSAYVGSANMLSYAQASAELGVVVQGAEARIIASFVRAAEAVSTMVDLR